MELPYIKSFRAFLQLEKGLSAASIEAYLQDLSKLLQFMKIHELNRGLSELLLKDLQDFIAYLNELGLSINSQARIVSSLKAFFRYLVIEEVIADDPALLLSAPKLARSLPSVLSYQEIEQLIAAIDHSKKQGTRNRAIIEVLYACGLRVSELTHLKLSNMYLHIGFIKVIGKGNKERMIPIGEQAIKHLNFYLQDRNQMPNIKLASEDIVFLNRRGGQLTRNMIFIIIKELAIRAGIDKKVSPHTFRHSFATHLIEGGANLRVVQDLLGHKSIVTTEIYTHLDMGYLTDTINRFHPRNQSELKTKD
ncbi:site-specific tyrosine recombinase XerD [Aureispira anguillae]|uniref:Tyrosine recombinase XerC n=1 Tax=Aureispira anguillae TaxID=2864201 RepID=A0A915YFJ4_9BACT|nr:site-specific tyrosine recombinase XerD [Aureispira anguillae]BDS12188.1 site-specific tyrosine recombinase XerD [Aureispira anguillae]